MSTSFPVTNGYTINLIRTSKGQSKNQFVVKTGGLDKNATFFVNCSEPEHVIEEVAEEVLEQEQGEFFIADIAQEELIYDTTEVVAEEVVNSESVEVIPDPRSSLGQNKRVFCDICQTHLSCAKEAVQHMHCQHGILTYQGSLDETALKLTSSILSSPWCLYSTLGNFSSNDIQTISKLAPNAGIVNADHKQNVSLSNSYFCHVTFIQDSSYLRAAEKICRKPVHTDCFTILTSPESNFPQAQRGASLSISVLYLVVTTGSSPTRYQVEYRVWLPYCDVGPTTVLILNLPSRHVTASPRSLPDCLSAMPTKTFKVDTSPDLGDWFRYSYSGIQVWKGRKQKLLCGPTFSLLYLLSDHLKFNLEIIPGYPGRYDGAKGQWVGGTANVINGTSDFHANVPSAAIYKFVDNSIAPRTRWIHLSNVALKTAFVCPLPLELPKYWNIIRPLEWRVWVLTMFCVLLCSVVAYAIEKVTVMYGGEDAESSMKFGYILQLFYGALFSEHTTWFVENEQKSIKVLTLGWSVGSMILVFAYNCNLKSVLIMPHYELPIETFQQLLASQHVLIAATFQHDVRTVYAQQLKHLRDDNRLELSPSPVLEQIVDLIAENKCLLPTTDIAKYLMYKYQKKESRVFFHVSSNVILTKNYGIISRIDDIYAEKIYQTVIRIDETGISRKFHDDHFPPILKQHEETELTAQSLDSLVLGFIFWAAGLLIASLVFLGEKIKGRNRVLVIKKEKEKYLCPEILVEKITESNT